MLVSGDVIMRQMEIVPNWSTYLSFVHSTANSYMEDYIMYIES